MAEWPGHCELRVRKIANGSVHDVADAVAVEHHLTVAFGGRTVAMLTCTPRDLEDLVVGLLVSRGLVPALSRPEEAGLTVRLSPDRCLAEAAADGIVGPGSGVAADVIVGPGSGVAADVIVGPGSGADPDLGAGLGVVGLAASVPRVDWQGRVEAAQLAVLAAALQDSPLFRLTGGTHSALVAALGGGGGGGAVGVDATSGDTVTVGPMLTRREDISRHNAVDKIIGHLWRRGRLGGQPGHGSSSSFILATSGRLSYDLVLRAGRARFPLIISPGAPTAAAVGLATEFGLTLVGFARGGRSNVYSHAERVC